MSYYCLGETIRNQRKLLKMTQEELACGITETYNLSRIENGKQIPTKNVFDAIMQRLGLDVEETYGFYLNALDFESYERRKKIKRKLIERKVDTCDELIEELENGIDLNDKLNKQFILSVKATNALSKNEKPEVIAAILKEAIIISIPYFNEKYISRYFLSEQEIKIINMMGIAYFQSGNIENAVEVLYSLKSSIDNQNVDIRTKSITYPMIMHNLSKYLGQLKRYDESIVICDIGESVCIENNRLEYLPKILFNKVFCLFNKGVNDGQIKRLIYHAYYGCDMLMNYSDRDKIKKYAEEKLGIRIEA